MPKDPRKPALSAPMPAAQPTRSAASVRLPLHGDAGTEDGGRPLLKIGDFAKLAGTNLRTLRYYEELALLMPAWRSQGGFRYYRQTDVNRLRMIQTLQELGLALERIAELLDTRREGLSQSAVVARVQEALRAQERLLAERVQALETQRAKLAVALEKLAECAGCELHPAQSNNFCEPCQRDGKPLPEDLSALF